MDITSDPLVSASWLKDRLDAGGIAPLDATWFFASEERDAGAEFEAGHIPGASFFDIEKIARGDTELPHMLPTPDGFAAAVGALGVGAGDLVVAYESGAPRSAARAWWSFRAMGHENVRVLDGGLPAWIAAGGHLETGPSKRAPQKFEAALAQDLVVDIAQVRAIVAGDLRQVIDARPASRFRGETPEPREGLRRGRIPGALSAPAGSLYDQGGLMLPPGALLAVLNAAGVELSAPAVVSCGSGVTACMIALALKRLGAPDAAVYDGSYAEWGRPTSDPVLTGA
jgi:thiosulfate/3-mercaptopyruvate sulfurtransferase